MADNKFNFFESYHRALSLSPDDTYGRVVKAMAEYVFNGAEPNLTETFDLMAWNLIKPVLEKGKELSQVRANAGRSGGRIGKGISRNVGNENARTKTKQKQINSKQKQNNSGIGIGEGIGIIKENTDVSKKNDFSLEKAREEFKTSIKPYIGKYGNDMCNDFFEYWTEPTQNGKKMRYQLERTWEIGRRLARWNHNQKQS